MYVCGMYVCGPTVYDYVHLGNARPAVVYDVLARLLRTLYSVSRRRLTFFLVSLARASDQSRTPAPDNPPKTPRAQVMPATASTSQR